MYKKFGKRLVDIVLSTCGIIVLAPLWLVLAIAIKIDDPGPIFFRQKRIAQDKNGEKQFFQIYKYRSMKMCTPKDTPTHLLENPEQYITKVGGFLRKTSLDELPQLFNVLKGEMSLVGPRPIIQAEVPKYGPYIKDFYMVRPGVTGMWQTSGRSDTTYEERVQMDTRYVRNWNVWFDIVLIWRTIAVVLKHKGAY